MAITALEYFLLSELDSTSILPAEPDLLEFGQSNWYGDVPLEKLESDIRARAANDTERDALLGELDAAKRRTDDTRLFDIAHLCLRLFTGFQSITAIDMHGADALRHDLNEPVPLDRRFSLTIDFGTAEHVFNVYQFFKTAHELTKPGGVMIHGTPFTGWIDHGFYTFQPTFYWDLAVANGYAMKGMVYGQLQPFRMQSMNRREDVLTMLKESAFGDNGMLFAVLEKARQDAPFHAPMQGFYAGTLPPDLAGAWYSELRFNK